METPKLYTTFAFRLSVYALLALTGGFTIWGEHASRVQQVSADVIITKGGLTPFPRSF